MATRSWPYRFIDRVWESMVVGAAGVDLTGLAATAYALYPSTQGYRTIRTEVDRGVRELEVFLAGVVGGT